MYVPYFHSRSISIYGRGPIPEPQKVKSTISKERPGSMAIEPFQLVAVARPGPRKNEAVSRISCLIPFQQIHIAALLLKLVADPLDHAL
jgi:hypothetical protein